MIKLIRTNSENRDFKALVKKLDEELKILDGDEHAFYATLNKTDMIKHVVVAYDGDEPVGCGAIREYEKEIMEVKRMFVPVHHRGKGIATLLLMDLEKWCKALHYKKCILETGLKQPEAIALYKKNNYKVIPNFGKYAAVENSVCFEKVLE